jgi:ubiquinone/menaquinone biosynthesis C-methylase UbiE
MKHPILRRIPGARQWIEKMERLERERRQLADTVEKLQAQLAPRREDYKQVWSDLSRDERSAKLHVGGFEDEPTFESTGAITREALMSSVGINPEDVVVEIGCGVGRVGKQLAPICRKWIGCDVSPHMVALARKRLADFPNVELHEISGFDLAPLPNESADVVYCTVVFMHLDDWDRYNYVVEAHRVLRPGGRIFIDNVDLCSDRGWEVFEVSRQFPPNARPPQITKHSTEQELTTYLRRAGFRDIRAREAKWFIELWATKP